MSDYYFHPNTFGLQDDIAKKMRIKMFEALMRMTYLTREATVLDVGATVYRNEACNFFKKLYPYPHKITAVATEDGLNLPFQDKSFDLGGIFIFMRDFLKCTIMLHNVCSNARIRQKETLSIF